MMPQKSDTSSSRTLGSIEGVGANAGAPSMPSDLGGVAPGAGPGDLAGAAAPVSAAPGTDEPRSALVASVLGNLSEGPFALAAVKTGHDHWLLAPEERALMSEAATAVVESYGLTLSPKRNPWGCLLLGYVGFGFPRIAEEIRLLRLEMKRKNDAAEAAKK